jgi:peptide/nickel transport system ATP-binding protein
MVNNGSILKVNNLKTKFFTQRGAVAAVDGVNFELKRGECLCLVGESGCGKSVTALSILGLIESPPGKIVDGEAIYNGKDLIKCSSSDLRKIRGKEIALIFQDALSALNPVFTIGDQIIEQIKLHMGSSNNAAWEKSISLLSEMGIPSPERAMDSYPHQLSGGMRQRAMIAMSLSCSPQILIADEPTTAVDVTIKAQILTIFNKLKTDAKMSLIFITHDFGVVSEVGEKAVIIYAGKDLETAPVSEIVKKPKHPYTIGLLACLPNFSEIGERLSSIPGNTPDPTSLPTGCPFHPRCPHVMEICRQLMPEKVRLSDEHTVSCHLYKE